MTIAPHYELSVERNHTVVGAELADALQLPRESVDRQLNRARKATLGAIAALVLARTGRDNCTELAQQLNTILSAAQQQASHNLILNPEQSTAIVNHTSRCPICGPRAKEAREYSMWALPAVLPLTHDDKELPSTAIASSSRTDSGPIAPPSPALGLPGASAAAAISDDTAAVGGFVERLRVGITSAIARMPGMNTVMQFAQQDPEAFRRIAGAVAGGVGLIAALVVATAAITGGSSQVAPTPPNTVAGPPAVGPPVAGPAVAGPAVAGPPVAGPPAVAGPPVAGPPAVGPPVAGPPAVGPPPAGPSSRAVEITFDAAALSYPRLAVSGVGGIDARQQTLQLLPGPHSVQNDAGITVKFTVTEAGRVDYDPSLNQSLSGRDSSTLVLRGSPITLNAAALSYPRLAVSGVGGIDARQQTLQLLPGPHSVQTSDGKILYFRVTEAGKVDYDPSLNQSLSGRGSSTLTISSSGTDSGAGTNPDTGTNPG